MTGVLLKGVCGQVHDLRVAYGMRLMKLPGLAEPTVYDFPNLERACIITFGNGMSHWLAAYSAIGTTFHLECAGILGL